MVKVASGATRNKTCFAKLTVPCFSQLHLLLSFHCLCKIPGYTFLYLSSYSIQQHCLGNAVWIFISNSLTGLIGHRVQLKLFLTHVGFYKNSQRFTFYSYTLHAPHQDNNWEKKNKWISRLKLEMSVNWKGNIFGLKRKSKIGNIVQPTYELFS